MKDIQVVILLSNDGTFNFDPKFVLVDCWGMIRGEYCYQTMSSDSDHILRRIGVNAEEAINSQGTASLTYEAAHYFLCYNKLVELVSNSQTDIDITNDKLKTAII